MSITIKIILIIFFIYLIFKYGNLRNSTKLEKIIILLIVLLFLSDSSLYIQTPIIFALVVFYVLYRRFRNVKYTVDAYNDINYLNRDIDTTYNPSIIGYLINMNIHSSDLVADIMNLYAKKIIDVQKINKNNEIKYHLKLSENYKGLEYLSESDQYILDVLVINKGAFFNSFDFKEWETKVIRSYRSTDLINEKIHKFLVVSSFFIAISLALFLLIFASLVLNFFVGLVMAALIIYLYKSSSLILSDLFSTVNDTCLSKEGKEEFKKWIKFKKFMEEYTLIKDKKLEDIVVYEHYVPYSVSLRIVDNYEDTMFKIFRDFELERIAKFTDV